MKEQILVGDIMIGKYILQVLSGGISEERWSKMSGAEKRNYIKEHPNSKYAREAAIQATNKKLTKYKQRIKELKEMRTKYKRKSNIELIDNAIKKLRLKIKGVQQKESNSNSKQDIKKDKSLPSITPDKMEELVAQRYKLIQESFKHNPGSKAQLESRRKLDKLNSLLKSPLKPDKLKYKGQSKEAIEAYEDDIKNYNEYMKRADTDVQKDFDKLVDTARRTSEEYRGAIDSWLRAKRKAPYSDETKRLGAKVGELKKKANDAAYEVDKYKSKHKNELNTGLLPPIPKLGYHKGRKLGRKLTEEERNRPKTPTRIVRRYRK